MKADLLEKIAFAKTHYEVDRLMLEGLRPLRIHSVPKFMPYPEIASWIHDTYGSDEGYAIAMAAADRHVELRHKSY